MPGRSLETQIASAGAITGPQREYVTQPLFAEEISMIIQSTAGLDDRKFFEQWQQLSYDVINFDPRTCVLCGIKEVLGCNLCRNNSFTLFKHFALIN